MNAWIKGAEKRWALLSERRKQSRRKKAWWRERKRQGIEDPARTRRCDYETVRKLRAEGMRVDKIARLVHMSRSSVYRILKLEHTNEKES